MVRDVAAARPCRARPAGGCAGRAAWPYAGLRRPSAL